MAEPTAGAVSPPAQRVTVRGVADAAGVSPAAVSYALRGIQVSEETQARVRKVANELGYEANPIARALASGRTGMVGILGPSLEDLWQQRVAAGARPPPPRHPAGAPGCVASSDRRSRTCGSSGSSPRPAAAC